MIFNNSDIDILVDKFASVPPQDFVDKEIECVYDLSKYAHKASDFSVKAVELFW